MAQVSIPPSPATMSRRAPLSNIPNAVNSPFRITTAGKRSRSQSTAQREAIYGQPPSKKQAIEASVVTTPRRTQQETVDHKRLPKKDTKGRHRQEREGTVTDITTWQAQYGAMFPKYTFFIEHYHPYVIKRAVDIIVHCGGHYTTKFDEATHLLSPRVPVSESSKAHSKKDANKSAWRGYTQAVVDKALRAGKDHLAKAEELRMRLWNLDKLERVCGALEGRMGELRIAEEVEKAYPPERIARKEKEVLAALDLHLKIRASQRPAAEARKPQRQYQQPVTDLTNILRYEKLHGPTDRDPHAPTKEMHYFKGYYLYVHDLQELHRPVLVKEFPKVPKRENGAWPQFRSSGRFRCPFVEDTPSMRERDKERERYEQYELKQGQAKRKESGRTNTEMEPRRQGEPPRPKSGEDSGAPINDARRVTQTQSALVSHGKRSIRRQENAIAFTSTNSHRNSRLTYEPVASGVQPSNITSAIRSQVVSSHRDIPGQRAGVSKEIYGLQRKVAGNALVGKHVSHPATLRKPQANPERVQPDQRTNKQSLAARTVDVTKQTGRKPVPEQAVPTTTERVPKPGYCENCRDKYEDFDTHIVTRKHRKFATDMSNWAELDDLLSKLHRPLKSGGYSSPLRFS